MVGLVWAASEWPGKDTFAKYANVTICNHIKNYIRDWDSPNPDPLAKPQMAGEGQPEEFYGWQSWSDREFIYAISEYWQDLTSSPLELREAFDRIKLAVQAIKAAQIGFTKRDRDILNARYFSQPQSSIETIARHHKISYARTVFLIDRMLKKIRTILESREASTPAAALRG